MADSDPRVAVISRALHTFHGRGYCTMGEHLAGLNFYCYDEARAILAALDGLIETSAIPTAEKTVTLSGRQKNTDKPRARARAHRA